MDAYGETESISSKLMALIRSVQMVMRRNYFCLNIEKSGRLRIHYTGLGPFLKANSFVLNKPLP